MKEEKKMLKNLTHYGEIQTGMYEGRKKDAEKYAGRI